MSEQALDMLGKIFQPKLFTIWPGTIPNLFSPLSPWFNISNLYSISAPGWNYTPITEWGEGDLNIEKQIANKVATPGRQLGIIGDALVALIKYLEDPKKDLAKPDEEAIGRLLEMVELIKPVVTEGSGKKTLRKIDAKKVTLKKLATKSKKLAAKSP